MIESTPIHKDHYGEHGGETCLEFSSTAHGSNETIVHDRLVGQKAYDRWHLSMLMEELLQLRALARFPRLSFDQIPRKEKHLLAWLAVKSMPDAANLLELGSSVFGLIDGLELLDQYFMLDLDQQSVTADLHFLGFDISALMNAAAVELHPKHRLQCLFQYDELPDRFDILYDRNVSSYLFKTSHELAQCINRSSVAVMNLFVSLDGTFMSNRMGKSLCYFDLKELMQQLDRPLYHLFGKQAPGESQNCGRPVVEGFFFAASAGQAQAFWRCAQSLPEVADYFNQKGIELREASYLLEKD